MAKIFSIDNPHPEQLNKLMQIWLDANMDAHGFIPKEYWIDNHGLVKKMLPCSEMLVYEEDVICGFIGVTDKSYVAGLFVLKQFQGRGLGAKLLDACKRRYPALTLDVCAKNKRAINFYQKHGFGIMDEKENGDTKEAE